MRRHERRLMVRTAAVGGLVTLTVLVAQWVGLLRPLERYLYDQRVAWAQQFVKPPTDELVVVQLDDQALETIGRWPWPRREIARLIDALTDAGAGPIALDIWFAEPQSPQVMLDASGTTHTIDHDAELAAAIARHGDVLVPMHLGLQEAHRVDGRIMDRIRRGLWLTLDEVREADGRDRTVSWWVQAYERAWDEVAWDWLRDGRAADESNTALLKRWRRLEQRYAAWKHLERLGVPKSGDVALIESPPPGPPIEKLAQVARTTGFVDYLRYGDRVVRSVPLLAYRDERVYPMVPLALVCRMKGVELSAVRVERDQLTLGDTVVPLRTIELGGQRVGAMMDVPWIGRRGAWDTMLDRDGFHQPVHQISAVELWRLNELRRIYETNERTAVQALEHVWAVTDPQRQVDAQRLDSLIPPTLKGLDESGFLEAFDATRSGEEAAFLAAVAALRELVHELPGQRRMLAQQHERLRERLAGKAVLVGWTATGVEADFVATSLHDRCPGVMVFTAVANGLLTGEMWRTAPAGWTWAMTLLLGAMASMLAARLGPVPALLGCAGVIGAYLAVNALLLFDYANLILGLSGPLVATVAAWSGATVFRLVLERAERARITRRFQSYVDPALVSYVLDHPDKARLEGEVRELTVVFTDLAGFTTISEQLQDRTVTLLSEYLGLMTPLVRERGGYVNKFLGDGMMFFYGAPRPSDRHAHDALQSLMAMYEVMEPFNRALVEQGLPRLTMRAGVVTGTMVVGDAGPPDASDYTVLGDNVNLAARLESANKATGTRLLINDRCHDLLRGLCLTRPIGRIRVVGKSQAVMIHEPLCPPDRADAATHRLIEATTHVVHALDTAHADAATSAINALESLPGQQKLCTLYRRAVARLSQGPAVIELDAK